MRIQALHPWDLTPAQAVALQRHLAREVVRTPAVPKPVRLVAGVDLSPPDALGRARGAVVVLSYPALEVLEVATAEGSPAFPYIPGLLSFRESPVLLRALERLHLTPDLLLVDGQGYAHPRRFGIACHLGLLTDLPAIGCAKSRLLGTHGPVGAERGAWARLEEGGEVIGAALRTRPGANPLYVSIGHRVDLETAVLWALACAPRYRVPEPTRLAHLAAAGRLAMAG